MQKTKNHLDLLWMHTLHIDTWIVDHITFSKNAWEQRIPIGSCLVSIHEEPDEADIIRYDRSPVRGDRPDNDGDALFMLFFYSDRFEFALYDRREQENKIKLAYEDPHMFDKLDSCIWNARTIDYIYADLKTIEENLRLIRDGMWEDPTKLIAKSIGGLGDIFDKTTKLEEHVRRIARYFTYNPAKSLNVGEPKQQQLIEDEQDDVPF